MSTNNDHYQRKIPNFFHEFPKQTPPTFDLATYRLQVGGAVKQPGAFSLEQLQQLLPPAVCDRRFYCVNGWSLQAVWGGYWLKDLLALVQPESEYPFVRSTSLGGYEDTTALRTLVDDGAMLVTHMDGEPLEPKRGCPLRLMVFNLYQFKGVKALGQIDIVKEYRPGTWQKYGYHDASIQPYPHLAIDRNEDLMPEDNVIGINGDGE